MGAPKLVRVERFDELKEGVRVELRNGCTGGGGNHPGILLRLYRGVPAPLDMGGGLTDGWELVPKPGCSTARGFLITPHDVVARQVFRWVDLDPMAEQLRELVTRHDDQIAAGVRAMERSMRQALKRERTK